jgi:hypothetical protein
VISLQPERALSIFTYMPSQPQNAEWGMPLESHQHQVTKMIFQDGKTELVPALSLNTTNHHMGICIHPIS